MKNLVNNVLRVSSAVFMFFFSLLQADVEGLQDEGVESIEAVEGYVQQSVVMREDSLNADISYQTCQQNEQMDVLPEEGACVSYEPINVHDAYCEPCSEICCPALCREPQACSTFRFSFRVGGFYPTKRCFRDTFGDVNTFYGAELDYTLFRWATVFINGDYYSQSGSPCCAIKNTRVHLYTGSVGVCFPIKICSWLKPYVGIGALVGRAQFKDHFEEDYCNFFEHSRNSKTAFGGVLKSGIFIPFSSYWFGEIFCDYTYLSMRFERRVNLGGFKFGGGIGMHF